MSDEPESAGWNAIDRALHPIYGDRQPKHYGTIIKWMLGGNDPLDGTSAYKRTEPRCHWHFVSYGLTELYGKESDNKELSGYGFELTFRLACRAEDEEPPMWALSLLQNLARYVFRSGNVFAPGHHMTLNGPIALGEETAIGAVLFVADPELPPTDTPHGRVTFVQVVGITVDELAAVQSWSSDRFSDLLRATDPLLITDLARTSILARAETARQVAEGIEKDGSSMGQLAVTTAHWEKKGLIAKRTRWTIDALGVTTLLGQLRGRLLHRRRLLVIGKGGTPHDLVSLEPAEKPALSIDPDGKFLVVALPPATAHAMIESLRPERGVYQWKALEGFEIEVVPTEIKDGEGSIIRVVG
jgi:suppressor of fused-like protein